MIYVTTTAAKVAHKSENYRPICGTPGEFHITLAADEMKACFLCETTPTPKETAPTEETVKVRAGQKIIDFVRAHVLDLDDTADAEVAAIIDATPPRRFGNGLRYTLEVTTGQRDTLAQAVIALHGLMAIKAVRIKDAGFGGGDWLLELADRIATAA